MTASNGNTNGIVRLIRDPLVGFALASGLLFWAYGAMVGDGRPEITVSGELVDALVADRELVLGRALNDDDVEAIVQGFIDQEVLVREAMARRLYLNDGQVRHRLADKMFYLLADEIDEPTQADLESFFEENRQEYRMPELVTFHHRYYGDDQARAVAASQVNAAADVGIDFYMGAELSKYAAPELVPIFGYEFTRALGELEPGTWHGPIESSRGWHLVQVEERFPERDIPLSSIQNRIRIDWEAAALAELRREQLDALRQNYRIVIAPVRHDEPSN